MKNIDLSIVIPVYNEEKALNNILSKIQKLNKKFSIIFVNDSSTDNSFSILQENNFKVISQPYNMGYGAALKKGIREADTEYIAIMDADFQHNPDNLENMLQYIDNYDSVIGARTSDSHFPFLRRPGKYLINKFSGYVAGFKIQDINSGFRIFKKKDIMRFIDILPNGFSFTTTTTLLFIKAGYSLKYIPIKVEKRKGKSTVKVSDGLNTLLLILKTLILFNPLKFFVPVSVLVFFTGIGELIYEYYINMFFNVSTSSLLLFISSLLVFLFGLISEQISQLKRIEK